MTREEAEALFEEGANDPVITETMIDAGVDAYHRVENATRALNGTLECNLDNLVQCIYVAMVANSAEE